MAASYPNSVKSFTVKADGAGNTINAAHINDLQDEVAAIEGGLLNGTAPLNSSNSTVAALSAGNSTLTNLNVTGGCTLALFIVSNLQVSSNSTLTNLSVTGGSTLSGARLSSNLTVEGKSTLAQVTAGASTLASLSVSGNSTLAAVNQGNSTLANLSVTGGSTFAGDVMPSADNTKALGSSSVRWMFSGKQITPGSIPSTILSTAGTPSTSALLTGGGWVESTVRLTPVVQALPSTITFTADGAETAVPITALSNTARAFIVVNGILGVTASQGVSAARIIDSTSVGITPKGGSYPAAATLSGVVVQLP